jgi:hypothetical protein
MTAWYFALNVTSIFPVGADDAREQRPTAAAEATFVIPLVTTQSNSKKKKENDM